MKTIFRGFPFSPAGSGRAFLFGPKAERGGRKYLLPRSFSRLGRETGKCFCVRVGRLHFSSCFFQHLVASDEEAK
jgi:hypothetical protein